MPVDNSAAVTSAESTTRTLESMQAAERNAKSVLDKDAFMKLLIEQMANQDPLSPSTDTEFIAQLAQFSMLEQIESLNDTMTMGQAYNMVGKSVTIGIAEDTGEATFITGTVEKVFRSGGIDYVVVGGTIYPAANVVSVNHTEDAPSTSNPLSGNTGLLGRTVSDGDDISGIVKKLFTRDGVAYAVVTDSDGEDHEIPVSDITEITND
ncbi:MAG TPA: flagellar hook capping FlgD N-terminal domain-containing protein [Feifaniaceae bacterium]|nr:flagellar hook capping FlgD N-terminal domain-containing protein [Feifaniaceae bacterium]